MNNNCCDVCWNRKSAHECQNPQCECYGKLTGSSHQETSIDVLVRDLTKAHPIAKSEARRRIQEYVDSVVEGVIKDVDKVICNYWQEDGGVDREKIKQQLKAKWLK